MSGGRISIALAAALAAGFFVSGKRASDAQAINAQVSKAQASVAIAPPGATSCTGCHAGAPSGDQPALPSLTGQSAQAIEEAMAGFRSGAREATLMNRIAKGFTEDETRAIARWLAQEGAR